VVSNYEKAPEFSKSVKAVYIKQTNQYDVLEGIVNMYNAEYEKIRSAFDAYDVDKNGFLDIKEIEGVAQKAGMKNDSDFKNALKALDNNRDGVLEFSEFLNWWKTARQHSSAVSKMYDLRAFIEGVLDSYFKIDELKEVKKIVIEDREEKSNKIDVKVETTDFEYFDFATRFNLKLAIGTEKHKEAELNFASKFNNKFNFVEGNWINLAFFTKPLTKTGEDIEVYLNEIKSRVINYAEKNWSEGIADFIREFMIFETHSIENSCHISMIFKNEAEELIKTALHMVLYIKKWLCENSNGLSLDFKIHSKECLYKAIQENKTLGDFLESAQIYLNSTCAPSRLKYLYSLLKESKLEDFALLQILFAPKSAKIDYKGPVNDFEDEAIEGLMKKDFSFLKDIIAFIQDQIHDDIKPYISRMEITFSMWEIFMNFQIYSNTLWFA